jgi:hypothetical protein
MPPGENNFKLEIFQLEIYRASFNDAGRMELITWKRKEGAWTAAGHEPACPSAMR